MSIRRILSIFKRDLKSSTREFLLLYMILSPLVLTIIFRFFIPSVNAVTYKFALDRKLGDSVIEEYKKYGDVEVLEGRDSIEDRVNKVDDIAGITIDGEGNYVVILEGNENDSLRFVSAQIAGEMGREDKSDYGFVFSNIGSKMSPLRIFGAIAMIIMAITLGGMTIGLNIIEEKDTGTISALTASPMNRAEFIAGKSVIGVVLPIIHTFIILWILGITGANPLMIIVMTLVSSLLTIVLGFLIGVMSGNQIAGIANMKIL